MLGSINNSTQYLEHLGRRTSRAFGQFQNIKVFLYLQNLMTEDFGWFLAVGSTYNYYSLFGIFWLKDI